MQKTQKKKSLQKAKRSNTHNKGLHTRVNTKRVTKKAERGKEIFSSAKLEDIESCDGCTVGGNDCKCNPRPPVLNEEQTANLMAENARLKKEYEHLKHAFNILKNQSRSLDEDQLLPRHGW